MSKNQLYQAGYNAQLNSLLEEDEYITTSLTTSFLTKDLQYLYLKGATPSVIKIPDSVERGTDLNTGEQAYENLYIMHNGEEFQRMFSVGTQLDLRGLPAGTYELVFKDWSYSGGVEVFRQTIVATGDVDKSAINEEVQYNDDLYSPSKDKYLYIRLRNLANNKRLHAAAKAEQKPGPAFAMLVNQAQLFLYHNGLLKSSLEVDGKLGTGKTLPAINAWFDRAANINNKYSYSINTLDEWKANFLWHLNWINRYAQRDDLLNEAYISEDLGSDATAALVLAMQRNIHFDVRKHTGGLSKEDIDLAVAYDKEQKERESRFQEYYKSIQPHEGIDGNYYPKRQDLISPSYPFSLNQNQSQSTEEPELFYTPLSAGSDVNFWNHGIDVWFDHDHFSFSFWHDPKNAQINVTVKYQGPEPTYNGVKKHHLKIPIPNHRDANFDPVVTYNSGGKSSELKTGFEDENQHLVMIKPWSNRDDLVYIRDLVHLRKEWTPAHRSHQFRVIVPENPSASKEKETTSSGDIEFINHLTFIVQPLRSIPTASIPKHVKNNNLGGVKKELDFDDKTPLSTSDALSAYLNTLTEYNESNMARATFVMSEYDFYKIYLDALHLHSDYFLSKTEDASIKQKAIQSHRLFYHCKNNFRAVSLLRSESVHPSSVATKAIGMAEKVWQLYYDAFLLAWDDIEAATALVEEADYELTILPHTLNRLYLTHGQGLHSERDGIIKIAKQIYDFRSKAGRRSPVNRKLEDKLHLDSLHFYDPYGVQKSTTGAFYSDKIDYLIERTNRAEGNVFQDTMALAQGYKVVQSIFGMIALYDTMDAVRHQFKTQFERWYGSDAISDLNSYMSKIKNWLSNIDAAVDQGLFSISALARNEKILDTIQQYQELVTTQKFQDHFDNIIDTLESAKKWQQFIRVFVIIVIASIFAMVLGPAVGAVAASLGGSATTVGVVSFVTEVLVFTSVEYALGESFGLNEGKSFGEALIKNFVLFGALKAVSHLNKMVFTGLGGDIAKMKWQYALSEGTSSLLALQGIGNIQYRAQKGEWPGLEDQISMGIQNLMLIVGLKIGGFLTKDVVKKYNVETQMYLRQNFSNSLNKIQSRRVALIDGLEVETSKRNPDPAKVKELYEEAVKQFNEEVIMLDRAARRAGPKNKEFIQAELNNFKQQRAEIELILSQLGFEGFTSSRPLFRSVEPGVIAYRDAEGPSLIEGLEKWYTENGGELTMQLEGVYQGKIGTESITYVKESKVGAVTRGNRGNNLVTEGMLRTDPNHPQDALDYIESQLSYNKKFGEDAKLGLEKERSLNETTKEYVERLQQIEGTQNLPEYLANVGRTSRIAEAKESMQSTTEGQAGIEKGHMIYQRGMKRPSGLTDPAKAKESGATVVREQYTEQKAFEDKRANLQEGQQAAESLEIGRVVRGQNGESFSSFEAYESHMQTVDPNAKVIRGKYKISADGKLYESISEIDVVIFDNTGSGGKRKLVEFHQVKSGENDTHTKANKQNTKFIDALKERNNGNNEIEMFWREGPDKLSEPITLEFDISAPEQINKTTKGPKGKSGFTENFEMNAEDLATLGEQLLTEQIQTYLETHISKETVNQMTPAEKQIAEVLSPPELQQLKDKPITYIQAELAKIRQQIESGAYFPNAPGRYNTTIKLGSKNVQARIQNEGFWGESPATKEGKAQSFLQKITPSGESFYLPDGTGGHIRYDGYTGRSVQSGKYIKGNRSTYDMDGAGTLKKEKVLNMANKELNAAKNSGLELEWVVNKEGTAEQLQEFFNSEGLDITVTFISE